MACEGLHVSQLAQQRAAALAGLPGFLATGKGGAATRLEDEWTCGSSGARCSWLQLAATRCNSLQLASSRF
eukprot:9172861-Alexandrium_andersonii.AAC.1